MTARRLVVFDMDGTLVDSQVAILAAFASAFAMAGHPAPPPGKVLAVVGLSLPEAVAALAAHAPLTDPEELVAHYRRSALSQRQTGSTAVDAPLYPGALDALRRLAAEPRTLLGVATGKARRGLDHVLAGHDLGGYFATLQTSDDHPSKPHPAMLLAALADTGVDAGRAVMVGDTEFDVRMGRAAGMATVGVTWGYHPRARLEAAGADAIVESFAALGPALDRLGGRDG